MEPEWNLSCLVHMEWNQMVIKQLINLGPEEYQHFSFWVANEYIIYTSDADSLNPHPIFVQLM